MKTDPKLRRMTLLGIMLMTMSVNVFANNANEEEKNATKMVVEKSVSRLVAEEHEFSMDISLQEEYKYISEDIRFEGYELDLDQITIDGDDPDCIEWVYDDSRSVLNIKVIARYIGRAILKLIFRPIYIDDGPVPSPIVVNIHITVNS